LTATHSCVCDSHAIDPQAHFSCWQHSGSTYVPVLLDR
jgi:hypothetical protein